MTATGSDRFEDRLLKQLRGVVAEHPAPNRAAPKRRQRGRLVLAGVGGTAALGAAALATVAIFFGSGGTTTNAYAIESRPDGIVLVSIDSPRGPSSPSLNTFNPGDAAGLQSGLEDAGVPAFVDLGPGNEAACISTPEAEPSSEDATAYGPLGWDGLNKFWAELRRDGGVAWGELPPVPELNSNGEDFGGDRLRDTVGLVARDGYRVFIMVNPSRIESGERLFITSPDGTMETINMSVSSEDPTAGCITSEGRGG